MLAIPSPTIWTPRAGPWWRMPSWRDLANRFTGHYKHGADGHLTYNASGHLVHCVDTPCSECTGTTPTSVTLTISGVVMCAGCYRRLSVGGRRQYISGSVNTTFVCTQDPLFPCDYYYYEYPGTTIVINDYDDADSSCATSLRVLGFTVRCRKQASQWTADVFCMNSTDFRDPNDLRIANFQDMLVSPAKDCCAVTSGSTALNSTCGSLSGTTRIGHSGSATITPDC